MFGEDGPDRIEGNDGADFILGQSGADEIFGQDGNDLVFGGDANDVIYGGDFADVLNGEQGGDEIHGGNGIDVITGNDGPDSLFGGDDADVMFGEDGEDAIRGEGGADVIFGKEDSDCIFGGTENDVIFGSSGGDWIYGEEGVDWLYGNGENDTMYGGPERDHMHGNSNDDKLSGEAGDDIIHGNSGDDVLLGRLGKDKLYGDRYDDDLDGGGDDDTVKGNWGDDTVFGGPGNDNVKGSLGSDVVDDEGSLGIDDFGHAPCSEIHGIKWDDADGDGTRDANEAGLGGWTIYLDLNGNNKFDTGEPFDVTSEDNPDTCRNEAGEYHLLDLVPGTYTEREVLKVGWVQTYPGLPTEEHVVELEPGEIVNGIDFGNMEQNSIEGTKWKDLNGNGSREANEPGLAGVLIYIDADNDGRKDTGEPSTLTKADDPRTRADETGHYEFVGLANGTFVIREVEPNDFVQTYPADRHVITVSGGEHREDVDFGNAPLGEIRGFKWNDLDRDGVHDANEPPMADVDIYLDLDDDGRFDGNGANPEPTYVTGQNGRFEFTDLVAGTYYVREFERNDLVRSFPSPQDYHRVELEWGEIVTGLEFGNYFPDVQAPAAVANEAAQRIPVALANEAAGRVRGHLNPSMMNGNEDVDRRARRTRPRFQPTSILVGTNVDESLSRRRVR
jgi:Ca2+-binding RTX toxin-like protein